MFNNLSAYTFLEAVKRMICKLKKKVIIFQDINMCVYNTRRNLREISKYHYLINLRHTFQKFSEEWP